MNRSPLDSLLVQVRARIYCEQACRTAQVAGIKMKREERDGNVRFLVRPPGGQIESGAWMIDPKSALTNACSIFGGRP